MKTINHYIVEIIYTMVPTYTTVDSQSRLVFLSGEKIEETFLKFKEKIIDLPKETPYERDFRIKVYVLTPDGEHKSLNEDDKNLLQFHKIFLRHFEKKD